MIETGGKLYDYCGACGKLVRLNKPIFGSLHICTERSRRESEGHFRKRWHGEKKAARKILRGALLALGLPRGIDDDDCMSFEECGIRLGKWSLCWAEGSCGGPNEVFLCHDDDGEFTVSKTLPKSGLSLALKKVLDENNLWEQLKEPVHA